MFTGNPEPRAQRGGNGSPPGKKPRAQVGYAEDHDWLYVVGSKERQAIRGVDKKDGAVRVCADCNRREHYQVGSAHTDKDHGRWNEV